MFKEKKWPKREIDYTFTEVDGFEKVTCVKILKGKYEGVVYHYGKVMVDEETEQPTLKFDYYVQHSGSFELEKLHKDKKFSTLMGDILVSIFDENIIMKENENESFGNDNTEEFDLQ
jgi:hypothetical protein